MFYTKAVVLSGLLSVARSQNLNFPAGFKFGSATSAYQTEGGWNASDKTESIWDHYAHSVPSPVADGSNGDMACDSYHLWRRDIEMAVELGLHVYRFSLSWPRILPDGFATYISEDGKNYYDNLIDGLLDIGIEPVVTIYHYDLPQIFQDLGGWANPLIIEWFADYARVVYSLFGDRVKTWITINEPVIVCDCGYNNISAPGIMDIDVGFYLCNKHVLMAHAKAWRIYDEDYKPKYHGRVSLTILFIWFEPFSKEDAELTELMREFCEGRFGHPIYSKEGGWPPTLEAAIAKSSKERGFSRSRLPEFTKKEIEFVRGTYDFYGLNHYFTRLVRKAQSDEEIGPFPYDGPAELGVKLVNDPKWKITFADWFPVYAEGLRHQLTWLKNKYGDLEFFITENGYPSSGTGLVDNEKIDYTREYLEQLLLSIHEDRINVTGYIAWALMDQFEWLSGYTSKFGLYQVDFESPQRTRTPRASARYYASVIRSGSLNVSLH